jgi:glycosyltransferase involved in cell wall biosynthesis
MAPRSTVTVVIPCFNQARYLPDAIRSALAQTHPPIECIVVDDGSTDETSEVAAAFGTRVIRQANRGVSQARNTGLMAARGEFIVFLDADDVLLPDAFARGADALGARRDLAAVVTRCEAMTEDGTPIEVVHHVIDPDSLYREWLSKNFVWTPGAAIFRRAALVDLGGFCTEYGPAADLALYLRLARDGLIGLVPGYSVRYRQHPSSMSRNPAVMLRATQLALRRERRAAPSWAQADLRRGRTAWCDWYGEQVVGFIGTAWRERRLTLVHGKAALVLFWNCPGLVARHAGRKIRRSFQTMLGSPSTMRKVSR